MSDFQAVAGVRAAEAKTLADSGHYLGAVYLAGYVVECRLKTYLQLNGIRFPRGGSEGHNLRGLWRSAGFPSPPGHADLFIAHWGTELRYETRLPADVDPKDLLKGGRELASWVATRIRQASSRRGAVGRRWNG
ncbi:HEPN domain-containing protein [Streptomyces sp. NRRL S-31]|uniref:HEPN domain-containing protein n=1 Tax=Streptomyces sp. NRRL S-31 TaxID=1463898 RepID=UPI000D1253F3|nr:HEPN domain-containing protein [Streptomyces sp. NRRL S-31]